MSLTFFDPEANREFVLRMERDREQKEIQYRKRKSEITADYQTHGLVNSTVHYGALWQEDLNHFRQLAAIARNAIFEIVEARRIRLEDSDIKQIQEFLTTVIGENAQRAKVDLLAMTTRSGMPPTLWDGSNLDMQIKQAISQEAMCSVSIRATELRRKQDSEKRDRRINRVEKLLLYVAAAAIGSFATLLTQWLMRLLWPVDH